MIDWQYYPRSHRAVTPELQAIISAFEANEQHIQGKLHSNEVLDVVAPALIAAGFAVETGKKKAQKIKVPVLSGRKGSIDKSFDVDAHHVASGTVLEVEAGRAVVNNQFLKDLFEACVMQDINYLAVAVLNLYKPNPDKPNTARDFETVNTFFDTLYTSGRLTLPLKGILVIGY